MSRTIDQVCIYNGRMSKSSNDQLENTPLCMYWGFSLNSKAGLTKPKDTCQPYCTLYAGPKALKYL